MKLELMVSIQILGVIWGNKSNKTKRQPNYSCLFIVEIVNYTNSIIAISAPSPFLFPILIIRVYPPFLCTYLGAISSNIFFGKSANFLALLFLFPLGNSDIRQVFANIFLRAFNLLGLSFFIFLSTTSKISTVFPFSSFSFTRFPFASLRAFLVCTLTSS